MDGQDSWKRTQDIDIDLADLLKKLCMQWRQILICALIFALLAGGYGYVRNKSSAEMKDADTSAEMELTQEEAENVSSALELEKEIKGLERYLDGSVLMQADPYHKYKVCMLYSIDGAERKRVQKITESYLNFIVNGGAAGQLQEAGSSWDMDISYLSEIITAYQKTYGSAYQVVVDAASEDDVQAETLFYVEITGSDAQMAEQMAGDMEEILDGFQETVKARAGSHKLELLGTQNTIVADSSLQTLQHDKRTQLASARTSLKAMTDAFSDLQMTVYQQDTVTEGENVKPADLGSDRQTGTSAGSSVGRIENSEETVVAGTFAIPFKYIFLGLTAGIMIYCCIYTCLYLFCDTVKSAEQMKELYTFPFYGDISLEAGKRKENEKQTDAEQNAFGQSGLQLLNRVRLACKNQGIIQLCAASDCPLEFQEKESLECMAKQLENFGIHTVIAENARENTVLWDTLTETEAILMVCRIGTTTHRMIDDAMRFYTENNISVMGAMAFSKKRRSML